MLYCNRFGQMKLTTEEAIPIFVVLRQITVKRGKSVKRKICAILICIFVFCTGMAVPESIEQEYGDGTRNIVKTYTLSPGEDPMLLIEKEPFEQGGYRYNYAGMTKKEQVERHTKFVQEKRSFETDTNQLEEILPDIPGSIPYDAEGYKGDLILDPSSIQTEAAGYASSPFTVSDTRTYTDLAYNDPSFIPPSVEKDGMTLSLTEISWQGQGGTGANGSLIPTSYTATAHYSATGSRQYATGYVTTALYTGEAVLEDMEILYTLTYTGNPVPLPADNRPDILIVCLLFFVVLFAIVTLCIVIAKYVKQKRKSSSASIEKQMKKGD